MFQPDIALKGFQNPTGHNNCFLNVGLQSLWHLAPFHYQFLSQENHYHDADCCLFCSLKLIFDQYKYGDSNTLPPTVIRNDLSFLFAKDSKFQLGQLDDAAEALESLLTSLHELLTRNSSKKPNSSNNTNTNTNSNGTSNNSNNNNNNNNNNTAVNTDCEPPCLVHRVFGLSVVLQSSCSLCHATSEPFLSFSLIDYIPAAALRYEARASGLHSPRPSSFSELLRKARSGQDKRKCANEQCGNQQAPLLQYLISRPAVYSVGFVWESDETPTQDIIDTLELIGLELDTKGLYHQSEAYFYSPLRGCWIGFDDVIVTEVGPNWSDVLSKCRRGKDQPALLFYEKVENSQNGNHLNGNTSPRNVTNGTEHYVSPRSDAFNGASGRSGHTPPRTNSDLISFSTATPSTTHQYSPSTYTGVSASPSYSSYSPYGDPYSSTRHDDLSLGHRISSKLSQKIHSTPPKTPSTSDSPYSYPLSALAPSTRGTALYATPTFTPTTTSPYYRSTGTTTTPSYSTLSSYTSTTTPSYPASTTNYSSPITSNYPPSTTPNYPSSATSNYSSKYSSPSTLPTSSAASTLRNGSPSRQRSDPFASLLATSLQPTTGSRGVSPSHQRPPAPSSTTTPAYSQYSSTRGVSPSHQRPPQEPATTPYSSSSASRGLSPAHQRPTEPYSTRSSTTGVYPSSTLSQRPLDYYTSSPSSKGLSASRSSAYPPAPTLNATPTRGTSPQRPSYDPSTYTRGLSPARSIPETPNQNIYATPSGPSISRTPTRPDASTPYYSNVTRNPSPSRITPTTVSTSASYSSRRNPSPSRSQPSPATELSSVYSRIDKSNVVPTYSTREKLDANMEQYLDRFQKLRLNENAPKPIPVSAPAPRYTSPTRTYPASSSPYAIPATPPSSYTNLTADKLNGTKLTPSPATNTPPSSIYKGTPPGQRKKTVHFQTPE